MWVYVAGFVNGHLTTKKFNLLVIWPVLSFLNLNLQARLFFAPINISQHSFDAIYNLIFAENMSPLYFLVEALGGICCLGPSIFAFDLIISWALCCLDIFMAIFALDS